jgi:uncharacterized protein YdaU (DUF1376 family)
MHYYSHHIGDFQRDTASLSDADTLAYLRLIWMYYDTEQPLPNQPEELAFKIGSTAEKIAIILKSYFYLDNDLWRHRRCDEEITKVYAKSETARSKAKKRWGNAAAMQQNHKEHIALHDAVGELLESQSNAVAMLQHTSSNAVEPKNDATHKPNNPINKKQDLVIPDWLPKNVWLDYCNFRKSGKTSFTDRAKELSIANLERLKNEGNDPVAVINQSIQNGWVGLFPLKDQKSKTPIKGLPEGMAAFYKRGGT